MRGMKKLVAMMMLAAVVALGTQTAFASDGVAIGDGGGVAIGDGGGVAIGDGGGVAIGDGGGVAIGDRTSGSSLGTGFDATTSDYLSTFSLYFMGIAYIR